MQQEKMAGPGLGASAATRALHLGISLVSLSPSGLPRVIFRLQGSAGHPVRSEEARCDARMTYGFATGTSTVLFRPPECDSGAPGAPPPGWSEVAISWPK